MSHTYKREVTIFEASLDLPPPERRAYLERTCAGDARLLERVLGLLELHETKAGALGAVGSDAPTRAGASFTQSEKPGDLIGPYKLLQQIGEGGCGVVYMAEQEAPIRRRVALKIIKLGMDTRQVIARFEAERQALALMDHPNIAKVFDAGATATGRPYFVMELVRGVRITEYCDEKKLPTKERLELFIQVCQAVQHAHQKGIIHRDLKPSNILVAVNDGVAAPKLLDFGIAKATSGERLTDKTFFTAFEQFIGTPAYMSPEQAEVTNVDIDTRSDIYSLGVLLYELLTGQTPFDAKELLKAGLDEMRRTLREQEPARPSTRLSTLAAEELTTTANRRGLEGPKLANVLRGDLDWIVMKCLEKDRARRYETANGLATDIRRHLGNEPVTASPPGKLYRLQKFVRRNKVAVSIASISLGCLLIALGGVTWGFFNERELRARDHAMLLAAQTTEKISNARQAYQESRRYDAEKLLNEIPLSALKPDLTHAAVRRSLGWWHTIHQEWDKASSSLTLLPRLDASNDLSAFSDIMWHTTVLAAKSDRNDYEAFRQWILTEYGQTADPVIAERVSKACLLAPADEPTLKRVSKLSEVVARGITDPRNDGWKKWALLALGLADYRRGDFTNAIVHCEQALAQPASDGSVPFRALPSEAVVAMCYRKLDQEAEARAALAAAREIHNNLYVGVADYSTANNYFGEVFDGLDGHILFREAVALLEGDLTKDAQNYVGAEFSLGIYYEHGWGNAAHKPDFIEAIKWYHSAAEHGSLHAQNSLAWLLATCTDPKIRDGSRAVQLAERAVEQTKRTDPAVLDTLAVAFAETGQFEKAGATEKKAIALNPVADLRKDLEAHLKMFESGKPWRE